MRAIHCTAGPDLAIRVASLEQLNLAEFSALLGQGF